MPENNANACILLTTIATTGASEQGRERERESKPISNNKKRQVHDREKEYERTGVIKYKRRNEQTLRD
jgi:hypothetical protein